MCSFLNTLKIKLPSIRGIYIWNENKSIVFQLFLPSTWSWITDWKYFLANLNIQKSQDQQKYKMKKRENERNIQGLGATLCHHWVTVLCDTLFVFWTLLDSKLLNMILHKVGFVWLHLTMNSGHLRSWLNTSDRRVSRRRNQLQNKECSLYTNFSLDF